MTRGILSALLGAALVGGCSSGGGGSDDDGGSLSDLIEGLTMPSNMSVVTAQDDGGSGPAAFKQVEALTDPGTDYSSDPVNAYVYDASMESLDTVNMILCLMAQTRASQMVNEGAYIALVNEDKCEQGQNQSSTGSTGQSSGGQATEFNTWTIVSTRESSTSPQVVKIWVPGEARGDGPADPMDEQTILVEVTVDEAAGDANPFGSFSMNFTGVVDGSALGGSQGTEVAIMTGTLQTVDNSEGQPQFRYVNLSGDALPDVSTAGFSMEEAASVILDDADGTGGVALTERSESFGMEQRSSTFAIAFNSDNLLRGKDDTGDGNADAQQCLSRTDFDTQVWSYNLYHGADGTFNGRAVTEGERVEMNSGFPFTYARDGGGQGYGWAGYHGLWAEQGGLPDGSSVNRFDYDTDTTTAYTVRVAPGKMIRRTANVELLSSFQGEDFQFWGQHPTLMLDGQWRVTVNGGNDFAIVSTFEWGENGPEMSETIDHDNDENTAEVAVAATLSLNDNDHMWFWSDSLGGNINYVHDVSVAAGEREVIFYLEEFVGPGDDSLFAGDTTSVTLYCYERCLKGGLTQGDVDGATSEQDLYYEYVGTPFQYTLSVADGKVVLSDDNAADAVVSAAGLDLQSLGFDWGINTGEMVTSPLADPGRPWEVYSETVTLRWETGANEWNQMVTLVDGSGNVASFDRPLQITYTHSTANDANADASRDGDKFLLEYAGPGQLWGFPWEQADDSDRWHAAVTLKDGAELTADSRTFVVKAIEKEQSMQEDDGGCGALNIATLFNDAALDLPDGDDVGSVSFTLADKPTVTDAPAVIEGEIQ